MKADHLARQGSRVRRGPPGAPGAIPNTVVVTIGELVDAVARVTQDPAEQVAIVSHILLTRQSGRLPTRRSRRHGHAATDGA